MKKLFVLMLALCLMCSVALAEEAPALNWADYQEKYESEGSFQQIEIPEIVTMLYWIPNDMAAFDASLIKADIPPVAVFASAAGNRTISVFALNITGLEEYLTGLQGAGASNFNNITVNGIDCIGAENEESSIDICIVPITETMVLVYNFTPLNGDDEWDEIKTAIVASVQVAQ